MKTVGEILKKQRIKKRKSLKQVQLATHISPKTITALEKDDFSSLPALPFIKGFIRIYADYLGLEAKKIIAILRRDWKQKKTNKIVHRSLTKKWQKQLWTPRTAVVILVFFVLGLFFLYLAVQLRNFFAAPVLQLETPIEKQVVKEKSVLIKGQTKKGTAIYVNDKLIDVDDNGKFNYQLELFPGENTIIVTAVNRHNKEKNIVRNVKVVDNVQ